MKEPSSAGVLPLDLEGERDGLLYVPDLADPDQAMPLLVAFHGAGGSSGQMVAALRGVAQAAGFLLLAPDSRGYTWDAISGEFGPDVNFLDRALEKVLAVYPVNMDHLGIGGFSDGASYALSIGLMNGDTFGHIMAFSPGFVSSVEVEGRPRLFIAHGKDDTVLSIDRTSRRIVPELRDLGLDIVYQEFGAGHTLPPHVVEQAITWFLGPEYYEKIRGADIRTRTSGLERT